MTLRQWVASVGDNNDVAKKLDVTAYAVRIWLRGDGAPSYPMAIRIHKLSGGRVDLIELYNFATRRLVKK
jgi:hypothetical protein